jgi:uncharacterized protein with NAD-binding domain and iron-sulfur cluster
MPGEGRKKKVAILGGGLAGLTTAYELASRSDDYEITIYQMGWRLGGKIASSRNPEHGMRIEERGVHLLFGAYENFFYVLRRVYGELGLRWKDAFVEHNNFTLMENLRRRWVRWTIGLPPNPGDPGDCLMDGTACGRSTSRLAADMIGWLCDRVLDHFAGTRLERPAQWFFGGALERARRKAEGVCEREALGGNPRRDARRLLWHLRLNLLLLRVTSGTGHAVWRLVNLFAVRDLRWRIDRLRRLWIMAEMGIACTAGLTRASLDRRTRHDLDDLDLTEWLSHNAVLGARISRTSRDSAPLRMVYEVAFAYEGGDPQRRKLAAGTAVRDLLRLLFDRRGALAYTMRAGSAETVVTPLYRALARRPNVRFEFFHRIDGLELSDDGRAIERIRFTRQAEPRQGPYDPLIDQGAWPDRPRYELLVDGERLKESEREGGGWNLEMPGFNPPTAEPGVLKRCDRSGGDFDEVVLAIPVEALREICGPLEAQSQRWQDMFRHLKTTPTQSAQLWFDRTAKDLGWDTDEPAILAGFAQPFGNWVDLSITLAHESWGTLHPQPPRSVAYLRGPLKESEIAVGGADTRRADVRRTCEAWLAHSASEIWPDAFDSTRFRWSSLIAPPARQGAERCAEQYFSANVNPSDRCTLTLPGATRYRLPPNGSGFDNLILAGDWTANGFDVGSVEATAMSGRLAARSLLALDAVQMPVYGEGD